MVDADRTSFAALVVALIALLVALGQLLAQVLGTVEGYRRCQPSVLGKFWSDQKKRRWRWTQFRIEILVTTPEIILSSDQRALPSSWSLIGSWVPGLEAPLPMNSPVNELVCWIPLLRSIHETHQGLLHGTQNLTTTQDPTVQLAPVPLSSWPRLITRQRSWDFMPPDVIRPFASTNLSDIAVIARRMGMIWTDFRPAEGALEAHGSGHVFSTTTVRGVGLMVNYRRLIGSGISDEIISTLTRRFGSMSSPDSLIPSGLVCTVHTDMMWFGILPGNVQLRLPNLDIGTRDDIYTTLNELDISGVAARHLSWLQEEDHRRLHGFCDIVPMVAPWLRQTASTLNKYPRPCPYVYGLTWYHVAYRAFYSRLQKYHGKGHGTGDENSPSTRWVQRQYEELHDKYGVEWDFISPDPSARTVDFFDAIQYRYEQTTRYFEDKAPRPGDNKEQRANRIDYMDLVTAHLREAPRSYHDAVERQRTNPRWTDYMGDRRWRGEAMMFYWDYMPDYVRYMREKGWENEARVEEAWIILVFRAFLWQRAHVGIPNEPPLPSRLYGSRLPVYIA